MSKLFNFCLLFLSLTLSLSFLSSVETSAQNATGSYKFVVPESYSAPTYGNFCVVGYSDKTNSDGYEYQLPVGEYQVKYLTFGSEFDDDCNLTGNIGQVVDTGTMTIISGSLTTITLDAEENLIIGEPEERNEGQVLFTYIGWPQEVLNTLCVSSVGESIAFKTPYELPVGNYTASMIAGLGWPNPCADSVVDQDSIVDTIDFSISANDVTEIFITYENGKFLFTMDEPQNEHSETPNSPLTTPRTGGHDLAKEAILVLFAGVSLGAIYLSLKPIKE